jgi:hypothetical protein
MRAKKAKIIRKAASRLQEEDNNLYVHTRTGAARKKPKSFTRLCRVLKKQVFTDPLLFGHLRRVAAMTPEQAAKVKGDIRTR